MTDAEQRTIFSKNLSDYVYKSGKQQKDIAKELGFNQKTFNGWCNGLSMPTMGKVQAIADYFGIGKTDLLDDKSALIGKESRRAIAIPVYGRVAAGIPLEMIEEVIDTEEIPEAMAKGGEYFCLQIHGDSMEPKMSEGDVVIVRKQDDAESGEIVIATVNGTDATCKRLKKYRDGIALISNNPAYDPMIFSSQEAQKKPVRILGKVVELRAKF